MHRNRFRVVAYLLFPRPGPFLSLGKSFFFLLGSGIALSAGFGVSHFRRWALAFIFYELLVSHGKYFLNDLTGRRSDHPFLRSSANLFPKHGSAAWAVGVYAAARIVAGIAGLLIAVGGVAAVLAIITVLLQVLYELIKVTKMPHRGAWSFLAVSANYGVRALVGMAAVAPAAAVSPLGLLTFGWASGLGGLFLFVYWDRQGQYYLGPGRASRETLFRYKPGVLTVYDDRVPGAVRKVPQRMEFLCLWYGMATIAFLLGIQRADSSPAVQGGLSLAYVGLAALSVAAVRRIAAGVSKRWSRLGIGAWVALGTSAATHALVTRTTTVVPLSLPSIAVVLQLVLHSGVAATLVGIGRHADEVNGAH